MSNRSWSNWYQLILTGTTVKAFFPSRVQPASHLGPRSHSAQVTRSARRTASTAVSAGHGTAAQREPESSPARGPSNWPWPATGQPERNRKRQTAVFGWEFLREKNGQIWLIDDDCGYTVNGLKPWPSFDLTLPDFNLSITFSSTTIHWLSWEKWALSWLHGQCMSECSNANPLLG